MLIWGALEHRVVGVGLDVLLQILWTLEALAAEGTLVWLERNVDTNMRSDVIALDGGGTAVRPSAGEVQVVGRLAANMALADVLIESFGGLAALLAVGPLAGEVVVAANWLTRDLGSCIGGCWSRLGVVWNWAVQAHSDRRSLSGLVLGRHVWQYCCVVVDEEGGKWQINLIYT